MRYRSGLQITFLDVGQGDCIYLAGEKGDRYLIDGGSSSKSDVGTYQILPFLKEEGADTLDAVFVRQIIHRRQKAEYPIRQDKPHTGKQQHI